MTATTASGSPPASAATQGPRWFDWTTPQTLIGSTVLVALIVLMLFVFSLGAVHSQRDALREIADHSARNVIAAQNLAVALADMDANAANALLAPKQTQAAVEAYNKARGQMTAAILTAAGNAAYEGEDPLLKEIAAKSAEFVARVQAAYTLQSSGTSGSTAQYLRAAELLDSEIAPAVTKLAKLNQDALNQAYETVQRSATVGRAFVWFFALALLGVLFTVQMYLSERMRRTLNPLLLVSTLMAFALLLYTNHALGTASHQLQVVKEDSFHSVQALLQAKAAAYDANARESRFLLDTKAAAKHLAAFEKSAGSLTKDPAALLVVAKSRKTPSKEVTGFLADEMRNITFSGERDAITEAIQYWVKYIAIDQQIRTLEQAGKHDKAIALCVGVAEEESNWAFDKFVAAIDKTYAINQQEFDRASELGQSALARFETLASTISVLICLTCLLGLRPRIREYSS